MPPMVASTSLSRCYGCGRLMEFDLHRGTLVEQRSHLLEWASSWLVAFALNFLIGTSLDNDNTATNAVPCLVKWVMDYGGMAARCCDAFFERIKWDAAASRIP